MFLLTSGEYKIKTMYFTLRKPDCQAYSRIDYSLISNAIAEYECKSMISSCPLSDHSVVNLKIICLHTKKNHCLLENK